MNGRIARLLSEKGFGFIQADSDNTTAAQKVAEDIFFHRSSVRNTRFEELREGDLVSFDVTPGLKGPRAENVRLEERP